jgi:hypothetical protein
LVSAAEIGQWVRCERIFDYSTERRMIDVCMIAEAIEWSRRSYFGRSLF